MKKYTELLELIEAFEKERFTKKLIDYFNKNVKDSLGYQCRTNMSLNESLPKERFGNQLNQRTIFITARTFDIWENALYDSINDFIDDQNIHANVERWNDAIGDMKYNGKHWEVKSTQNTNGSWTGSTHSSQKCNRYILISFELDWDFKLNTSNNKGLLKSFSMFLVQGDDQNKIAWSGKATNRSSFTTLRIKSEWLNTDSGVSVISIAGKLKKNKVNCAIIPLKLNEETHE